MSQLIEENTFHQFYKKHYIWRYTGHTWLTRYKAVFVFVWLFPDWCFLWEILETKTKKHSLVKQTFRLSKDIFSVFAELDRECIHWQKLKQQRKYKKHRGLVCRKKFTFYFFNLTIQNNVLNYLREVMYTRKKHF